MKDQEKILEQLKELKASEEQLKIENEKLKLELKEESERAKLYVDRYFEAEICLKSAKEFIKNLI